MSETQSERGLTSEDLERLQEIAEHGAPKRNHYTHLNFDAEPNPEPRWGLTTQMCNAIREAAHDGHTAQEIADLFSFIESSSPAHYHATGQCGHDADVPPAVFTNRRGGKILSYRLCRQLRWAVFMGFYARYEDAGAEYGLHGQSAHRHVTGACDHTGGLPDPEVSAGEVRGLRAAAGLTQREAAERIGVSRSTWASWEAGLGVPRLCMAYRVRRKLREVIYE